MVRLLAYFQRQQRRNFTNQNVEIYKLVYQYSHTHPIPNTPNSSLTNTRNRENLAHYAHYAKLENSHNNMQCQNSLLHFLFLFILPSIQLPQHLSLYRISSRQR